MPIHLPGGTASYPEFEDLADRVVNGDGVQWAGDPTLWLGVGVAKYQGKTGHRIEVWRHTEDGEDVLIGTWAPSDQYRVCFDLAQMRLDAPGRVSAEDRIDAHNAKLEAAQSGKRQDMMAEKLERAAYKLMRAQGHARNRFSLDKNPLAKDS